LPRSCLEAAHTHAHAHARTHIRTHTHTHARASAQSVTNEAKLRSHDFMQLLFHSEPDLLKALTTTTHARGSTFECRLHITHPPLRACMGLHGSQESYHDLQVSLTKDPANLQPLYIISQMDVTEHVVAQVSGS
jgi:hypothetical protein